jgi:acyl-CoA reductase-like NAD-dependent aldehyde dehydrogenase
MRACPRAWSTSSAATGPAAGAPLVEHPDVRAISFTGSSEVGSLVGSSAPPHFKPVSLEMGGKNAQIVLDDANLELALEGALWGAFGTTGQRCTATSRILLQRELRRIHRRVCGPRRKSSRSATASTSRSKWARR